MMVRPLSAAIVAFALSVAATGTALAAQVVITPPIPGGIASGDSVVCYATNAGSKAVHVTVTLVDTTGVVLGGITALLDPGETHPGVSGGYSVTSTHCNAHGLSRKNVTVTYLLRDASNNILMSVTAP